MQSASELAPEEDQGVLFNIVEDSANSTLGQAIIYADAAEKMFSNTPETDFVFQLITPGSGFGGGMVLKPWDERERTVFEVKPEIQKKLSTIPGINSRVVTPPALPGGGIFPVEFVITSTEEADKILNVAHALKAKAMQSGMFAFPPIIDTKIGPWFNITASR